MRGCVDVTWKVARTREKSTGRKLSFTRQDLRGSYQTPRVSQLQSNVSHHVDRNHAHLMFHIPSRPCVTVREYVVAVVGMSDRKVRDSTCGSQVDVLAFCL